MELGKGVTFDHATFACEKFAQELSDVLRESVVDSKLYKGVYDWDYPLQSMIGTKIKPVYCRSQGSSEIDRFYCAIQKGDVPQTVPLNSSCPEKFSIDLPRSVVACVGNVGCTKSDQCPEDKLCCASRSTSSGTTLRGVCKTGCVSLDGVCRINSDCEANFCSNLNGQLGGVGVCRNLAAEASLT
jgi:hypothetical protein